nr:DEAD/DEAH box helicase family protein [uncultured Dyadobacter sp.]
MNAIEKLALTNINKIPLFKETIRKLTVNTQLTESEKTYILACAILFLRQYGADNRFTSYVEFSYYIVVKYSTVYQDYKPLYDFSASFGFYPTVRAILDNSLIEQNNFSDCLMDLEMERFRSGNYIETFHQYQGKKTLLQDPINELSFIAPTSFGKSSVIIDCILKYDSQSMKIGIVVPTKSLLMQTYRMIRDARLNKKIIIHDEMYQKEDAFIAIFTQERSLRLLSKFPIHFDLLFIDEAHNLLKDDSRSVLLSRLLAKNRGLNPQQRVVYLSPLIEDVKCLKVEPDQIINEHRVPFNIKEPEIYEYRLNQDVYSYNRFVGNFYLIGTEPDLFHYIINRSHQKNFIYNFRPVSIEQLAKALANRLPLHEVSPALTQLINILESEVHERFYAIDCIRHGVVYLHGKLPDLIKEYLESKFRDLPEIRYIIANSVILEGMNLPIDNLYILNTRSLYGKELTNLIGRVNRLNTIFSSDQNNLGKLLPPVHFVNSENYNRKGSNMSRKIELLRSRTFKDTVENPTLVDFDFDELNIAADQKERKRALYDKIRADEQFLNSVPIDDEEKLKQYLIETGISLFYKDIDVLVDILQERISRVPSRSDWPSLNMMDKIYDLFLRDITLVADYEFSRLGSPEARSYYDYHITISQRRALKENVIYQFGYFKKRVEDNNPVFYFGETYGERERNPTTTIVPEPKTYIDLSTKNDTELINLAIVKLKMEDDFVSFKLNKFIVMMYDYELISRDDYNMYIYGTADQAKIDLTKIGLSISLISRLEADGQLQHLYFDSFNNLKAREEFDDYKASVNDFYRFEIERFL